MGTGDALHSYAATNDVALGKRKDLKQLNSGSLVHCVHSVPVPVQLLLYYLLLFCLLYSCRHFAGQTFYHGGEHA